MVEFRNSPTWDIVKRSDGLGDQVAPKRASAPRLRADLEIEVEVRRQYGPVDIDDGPYRCDIVACTRLRGFRSEESLDRHKRLYH